MATQVTILGSSFISPSKMSETQQKIFAQEALRSKWSPVLLGFNNRWKKINLMAVAQKIAKNLIALLQKSHIMVTQVTILGSTPVLLGFDNLCCTKNLRKYNSFASKMAYNVCTGDGCWIVVHKSVQDERNATKDLRTRFSVLLRKMYTSMQYLQRNVFWVPQSK